MCLLQGEQEFSGSCFRMVLVPQLLKRSFKFPDLKEGYDLQKKIRPHNTMGVVFCISSRVLFKDISIEKLL